MLLAMILGGYLTESVGFRTCSDVLALIAMFAFILNTTLVMKHPGKEKEKTQIKKKKY
jgi:hypothetical protein